MLRRRSRRLNTLQIKQLQDGEEIYNALNNAPDPQAFQVCPLSPSLSKRLATPIHIPGSLLVNLKILTKITVNPFTIYPGSAKPHSDHTAGEFSTELGV